MCSSNIFSIQWRLDIGLYDSFENLSFPCFSIGRIQEVLRISGNFPAISDLLIANAMWGAHAFGDIFRNFMLVSLNPLADEFFDFDDSFCLFSRYLWNYHSFSRLFYEVFLEI